MDIARKMRYNCSQEVIVLAVSDKQKAWAKKYLETQDDIRIRVPKEDGTKARWAAAAEAAGKSLQRYIIDAVEAAVAGSEDAKKPEA